MGRLTSLKPALGTLRPSAVYVPQNTQERDRFRASAYPWRKWYGLKRWKQIRSAVLLRDSFTCQMCKRIEPNSSKLVADHKEPHRGDPRLFWDERNVWTLCKLCHDSEKQKQETGR